MIHHVGWEGGQHGWRSRIRGICGSAWFERFRRAGAGMKWLGSVSASCVIKLMHRYEATGDVAPGKFGGHKRSALIGFEDKVRGLVAEQPDVTVTELWRKLTGLGIKVGRSAVGRFLQRLQLTFKKTGSGRRPACGLSLIHI